MAGGKVSTVAKPQLRGLLTGQIKLNLSVAVVLCVVASAAQVFLYNNKKKQVYADFYKKYDINKEFEKMKAKGLFDSC